MLIDSYICILSVHIGHEIITSERLYWIDFHFCYQFFYLVSIWLVNRIISKIHGSQIWTSLQYIKQNLLYIPYFTAVVSNKVALSSQNVRT